MNRTRIFFDVETTVNLEAVALMPEPKAPGNLKDPDKIAAAIAEKKAELIDFAALDPDYGKVLSIGYTFSADADVEPFVLASHETSEEQIIQEFWLLFWSCGGNAVGYNILGFDLPYLLRRSMALGIRPARMPNLARYNTEPITDLMMILYNWGSDKYKGLKQVARLYGIPNDCPDVNGAMVKNMTPEQLHAYQVSDVKLLCRLYNMMNGVYFHHGSYDD